MAREVVKRPKGAESATTSCTRRYRSKHPVYVPPFPSVVSMNTDVIDYRVKNGLSTTVESVVIEYGQVTFAIYTTASIYGAQHQRSISAPNLATIALENVPTANHHLVDSPHTPFRPIPLPLPLPLPVIAPSPIDLTFNKRQRQTRYNPSVPVSPYQTFNSDSDRPLSISTARRFSSHALFVDGHGGEVSPTVVRGAAILGSLQRSIPAGYEYKLPEPLTSHDPTPGPQYFNSIHNSSTYPPTSLHHPLSESYRGEHPHLERSQPGPSLSVPSLPFMHSLDTPFQSPPLPSPEWTSTLHNLSNGDLVVTPVPPPRSRGPKPKPETVMKRGPKPCGACGIKESPEWRKGPGGAKTLCNGCGESCFPFPLLDYGTDVDCTSETREVVEEAEEERGGGHGPRT